MHGHLNVKVSMYLVTWILIAYNTTTIYATDSADNKTCYAFCNVVSAFERLHSNAFGNNFMTTFKGIIFHKNYLKIFVHWKCNKY